MGKMTDNQMTDNQTTELQSLSKLKMAGRLRYWRGTIEIPEVELHAICDEIQAEHDHAIAATLGSGTCRNQWQWDSGFCCSECFYTVPFVDKEFRYCPNCRKTVER